MMRRVEIIITLSIVFDSIFVMILRINVEQRNRIGLAVENDFAICKINLFAEHGTIEHDDCVNITTLAADLR